MKKAGLLFLSVIMFISLSGCSFTKFDGSRTGNDSQLVLAYKILNTTYSQSLELTSGDIVSFKIISESGKVSVILQSGEDDPVYKGTNIPTSSFEVEIMKSGTYQCSVTGEKARGSVSIMKKS